VRHERNQGKGAALRTAFAHASGDVVAVQDADLEYDPQDLKRMLVPIREGRADVVFGSRFLTSTMHRVLYFWHSVANKLLTLLSNMFTDLNLSDMECCYKVFTREVASRIVIREDRFGVEPELVAQVAQMRVRVYEMGISYDGRTYEEGKKIGLRDAFRALYCIVRYNAGHAPLALQFLVYAVIGSGGFLVNLALFLLLHNAGAAVNLAAPLAYVVAAAANYGLCTWLLFERRVRWGTYTELGLYAALVAVLTVFDLGVTRGLLAAGLSAGYAKSAASLAGVLLNFLGRRFLVFPQIGRGVWRPGGSARSRKLRIAPDLRAPDS
jgi:glycosyltransferase involved in cell wall biosynthesis